jgi:hypothetical protein
MLASTPPAPTITEVTRRFPVFVIIVHNRVQNAESSIKNRKKDSVR